MKFDQQQYLNFLRFFISINNFSSLLISAKAINNKNNNITKIQLLLLSECIYVKCNKLQLS